MDDSVDDTTQAKEQWRKDPRICSTCGSSFTSSTQLLTSVYPRGLLFSYWCKKCDEIEDGVLR